MGCQLRSLEISNSILWKARLNEQNDFERLVLFRKLAINDIIQTSKKEMHFFFFSVVAHEN